MTNSTNGSWWSLQVLPTSICSTSLPIPPTAVGGPFKSYLHPFAQLHYQFHQRQLVVPSSPTYIHLLNFTTNSTNGSWWSLQVLPTSICSTSLPIPPTAVGGPFKSYPSSTAQKSHWTKEDVNCNSELGRT